MFKPTVKLREKIQDTGWLPLHVSRFSPTFSLKDTSLSFGVMRGGVLMSSANKQ